MASVETVSVLITDLVGSTGLGARVGPAAADQLRREFFAAQREAIEDSGGREVKNTGDGLLVVFPSAAAAVACGVGMQQRLDLRNQGEAEQLVIRVGIGLGDATAEDDDYFGTPVIEAARLCDKAEGGQILTTETVRVIGGRDHDFASVGAMELKGLPEPAEAYEVPWQPLEGTAAGAPPLPPRLRGVPPVQYVGRDAERDRVKTGWQAARDGRCQALLVSGEPGIGKTRLATHGAIELHSEGASVLFGRCEEEVGAPYGAWAQALAHCVEHAPDELLARHVERHGGELSRLAPSLRARIPDVPAPSETDQETERYLLFSAVIGILEEASSERPVVLLLDDLHWADGPTLALLKHFVREATSLPLLVLGTYRQSDLTRDHPLTSTLADLRRVEGVERLALEGLSAADVVSIMEAGAGHEMDETGVALASQIARETDGNPFFVGEMLRHLMETETIAPGPDGRWKLREELSALGLPQSVREVVGRRIDRLGERARGVLTCAAVIGRDFDLDLLVEVAREEEEDVLDMLEAAVEASVLLERSDRPGSFSFAHALVNHTLYDEFGATRRSRLHRRVAEALEEQCGDDPGPRVSELARHWSAATAPVETAKALQYSRQAGQRALSELAPDAALGWFSHALEMHETLPAADVAEQCELLIGLGEAQRQTAQPEYRDSLLAASRLAADSGDAALAARAALANTRGFTSTTGQVDDERLDAIEGALELVGESKPATRAQLLSLLVMESMYREELAERRELCEEALGLARRSGDARMLAHTLWQTYLPILAPETKDEAAAIALETDSVAGEVDDPYIRFWAKVGLIHSTIQAGDMDALDRALAEAIAIADALGHPVLRWATLWSQSWRSHVAGRLAEAESKAEQAFEAANDGGQPDAIVLYAAQLCETRTTQGRADEILELLEQAVEENPGIPSYAAMLTNVYCQHDADDAARALLDQAAADGFAGLRRDFLWLVGMTNYAAAAAHLHHADAAAVLLEQLEPWADQVSYNAVHVKGSVHHYLGLLAATLGDHDRALTHFAAAADKHEQMAAPLLLAQTRLGWASCLIERGGPGDSEEAARMLELAAATAGELGAATLERRLRDRLKAGAELGLPN